MLCDGAKGYAVVTTVRITCFNTSWAIPADIPRIKPLALAAILQKLKQYYILTLGAIHIADTNKTCFYCVIFPPGFYLAYLCYAAYGEDSTGRLSSFFPLQFRFSSN